MPIFVLGARNRRVHVPHQPLAVSITGSVYEAQLDFDVSADQPVVASSAHHAVLPRMAGPVTIAVHPVGVARFPPGTVIHLAISHDNPEQVDPVQVLFDPVDVSGDSSVVFAQLRPDGSQIEVSVSAVADTPLSPLGSAARSSARRVTGRVPTQSTGSLVMALDTSGSMRPWFADGSVAAATDVVVGVAAALGFQEVSAVLVGAQITPIVAGPGGDRADGALAGLADAVRHAEPRWSTGVRWSELPSGPATIVCTDFPTAAVRQRFPVLILANDRRLDASGARLPSPRPGEEPSAELLAHPSVLDRITADLVRVLA